MLRREGHARNHKRPSSFSAITVEFVRCKGKRRLPTRAPVSLEEPTSVNRCWSVDFMSGTLLSGQRFRTFNVLDDFSREILAVEVDTNLPAMRIIRVLDRIAAWRGYPAKLRVDNGPEFVSVQLASWAEQLNNTAGNYYLSSRANRLRIPLLSGSTVPSAMRY